MVATHFNQWIYNNIRGTDYAKGQRFEMRINCGTSDFDLDVSSPAQSIVLNEASFILVDFGKIKKTRFDENAKLELDNRTFGVRDLYKFSGVSNGSPYSYDLAADFTSLIPFIFNDLTKTHYVWLSQLNLDGTPITDGIYFSGHIDPRLITSIPKSYYRPMSATESKIGIKRIIAVTASSILQAHTVQELVSGSRTNGVPDGRIAGFLQSDMRTSVCEATYGGFVQVQHIADKNQGTQGILSGATLDKIVGSPYGDNLPNFAAKNYYGVLHGLQWINYDNFISKIADIAEISFTASDSVDVFSAYENTYSDGTYNDADFYSITKIASLGNNLLNLLCVNYNVKLGIRPDDFYQGGSGTDFPYLLNPSTLDVIAVSAVSPPVSITTSVAHNFHTGFTVGFYDTSDLSIGSKLFVGKITVVNSTTFTVDGTTGSEFDWSTVNAVAFGGEDYYLTSAPAAWTRATTLGEVLRSICIDKGFSLEWDIVQSGTDKGKPKLKFVNPLEPAEDVPVLWSNYLKHALLDNSSQGEVTINKHHVEVKYRWDDTIVYCPDKFGEGVRIEIEQSTKRFGFSEKFPNRYSYLGKDFINNPNSEELAQWSRFTTQIGGYLDLSTDWWILGARDAVFKSNPVGTIYSSFCANNSLGITNNEWTGFYPASYEMYQGGDITDADTNEDYYNRLVSKAQFYATLYLLNTTIERRSFRSARDDSGLIKNIRPRLKASWRDEDGIVRDKIIHSVEIEEIRGICDCEFITSPPVYFGANYDYIIDDGSISGTGGIVSPGGSGGGGSKAITGFVATKPTVDTRNDVTPSADTITGIRLRDFSNTHSANKLESTNLDGTTTYSGILPRSGFFTKVQNAFQVQPFGVSAGNTGEVRFLELAANGVNYVGFKSPDALAADVIFTLPNADGLSNHILITSGSKVLSLTSLAGLIDVANGILVTESGAHHPIIGISTNGIALDRIVQIADQTILGNNAGSTGNILALTSVQARTVILPSQASNSGKFLITNGTDASWATVTAGMTNPMTTLGDIIYEDATPTPARLAGNITTTQKFLAQTGNGSISAAPSWVAVTLPVGANPSASVGLTAVNGSATTFLRSDGAPALSQSIVPTWTGLHTFNGAAIITAPASTIALAITGAAGVVIAQLSNSASTTVITVDSSGYLFLGDLANNPATAGVLNVTQPNNTTSAIVIKEAASHGGSLLKMVDNADVVRFDVTNVGMCVGGATPTARLDVRPTSVGDVGIALNTAGSVINKWLQNSTTTAAGAATLIHSYATATGSVLFIKCFIIGRVTAGAGVVGNGVVIEFLAAYKNIAGVVTQIGADTKTVLTDDAAYTATSNVNGTAVELKVTGKGAHALSWCVLQMNGAY